MRVLCSRAGWMAVLLGLSASAIGGISVDNEAWNLYLAGQCGLAVDRLRPAAESGHVASMLLIAECSESGKGMVREPQAALAWRRRAADAGDTATQFALGTAYARGEGGAPTDKSEALRWYRRAADAGHPNAQLALARALQSGDGVKRDDAQAVAWFAKAAESGLSEAQLALAEAYEQGRGVKADPEVAGTWRKRLKDQAEALENQKKRAEAEQRARLEAEMRAEMRRRQMQMDDWYWRQRYYCSPYSRWCQPPPFGW